MSTTLETTAFILKQSLTSATPMLIAGYGELLAQRAGVINVGIEGLMLMGCIAAFAGTILTGSALAGVLLAALVAAIFAAIFALITILFRADQIVTGTALNILAFGSSTTIWSMLQKYMTEKHPPIPPMFNPLPIPVLSQLPLIGGLFQQYALGYIAIALALLLFLLLRYTRVGLILRALGDAPDAADAAGIRVRLWRFSLVLLAGALAGVAGSYLAIMRGHSFQINMTAGQGFLVLALVIFGRWNILGLLLGTLLFGALDALQSHLASIPGATQQIPHSLFGMLPYAATLVALALMRRSHSAPLTLAKAWPEDR